MQYSSLLWLRGIVNWAPLLYTLLMSMVSTLMSREHLESRRAIVCYRNNTKHLWYEKDSLRFQHFGSNNLLMVYAVAWPKNNTQTVRLWMRLLSTGHENPKITTIKSVKSLIRSLFGIFFNIGTNPKVDPFRSLSVNLIVAKSRQSWGWGYKSLVGVWVKIKMMIRSYLFTLF